LINGGMGMKEKLYRKKKIIRFLMFSAIIAVLSFCIYYSCPRNININYNGVKYQTGNQDTYENVKVNVEGKLRKKLFSGKAEFNGKIILNDKQFDYSAFPLDLDNKGSGILEYKKSDDPIIYGSIVISGSFENMAVMIYENGGWSSKDGWVISAPCNNREEAAAASNLLFKRLNPGLNIK